VCGAFGTLAVGLFATETTDFWKQGLFYGGGADQLVTQLVGVVAVGAFVAVTAGALFIGLKRTIGLRVTPEEEMAGLDVEEHGTPGYASEPGFATHASVSQPASQLAGAQSVGG
jgi:Amt family ammonium transporter